jgi:hypothetical protein
LSERLDLQRLEFLLGDRAAVEQLLGASDLVSRSRARGVAHVLVERLLLRLHLLDAPLAHAVVLGDQIDQHA